MLLVNKKQNRPSTVFVDSEAWA
uniref:Uncharacterized protein n=1 Tax=Rhizophora mucronata TaxID=61149 RepID=A0A2P2IJ89_RHIMU